NLLVQLRESLASIVALPAGTVCAYARHRAWAQRDGSATRCAFARHSRFARVFRSTESPVPNEKSSAGLCRLETCPGAGGGRESLRFRSVRFSERRRWLDDVPTGQPVSPESATQ